MEKNLVNAKCCPQQPFGPRHDFRKILCLVLYWFLVGRDSKRLWCFICFYALVIYFDYKCFTRWRVCISNKLIKRSISHFLLTPLLCMYTCPSIVIYWQPRTKLCIKNGYWIPITVYRQLCYSRLTKSGCQSLCKISPIHSHFLVDISGCSVATLAALFSACLRLQSRLQLGNFLRSPTPNLKWNSCLNYGFTINTFLKLETYSPTQIV